jgi:AcrR family transcriptional regulator
LTDRSVKKKRMPRTKKQFEDIRGEKRKLILDAAMSLFAERGYASTSMEQIARRAGISKGLIYNYFSGKEGLLKSIFCDISREMTETFDADKNGILAPRELKDYVENTFAQVKRNTEFWKIYTAIAFQPEVSRLLSTEHMKVAMPLEAMFLEYFRKQGYKKPETEMAVFASLMGGAIIKFIGAPDRFPIDEVKKRIIELYVK